MKSPDFTITDFNSFCVYTNPYKYTASREELIDTLVSSYEFRFYPEDLPGGVTIDGVRYPARKGCFTFSKPGQKRRITLPFKCFYFNLTTQDAQLRESLDRLPTFGEHPQMDEILDICKRMKWIVSRNTVEARIEMCGYIYKILNMLLRQQYAVTNAEEGNIHRHQQALLAADQYLRDHISEDIDLKKLAQGSSLNPTYFHKLFTTAFGKTPAQQLLWYRHLAAKNYLRDDDCPLSEIAVKCGFSSQSYFCYKFKQLEGMTPSTYRSNRRGQRKRWKEEKE